MKSDNTFISILCRAQSPIPILTRSLRGGGDSKVCVCVFADMWVPSQYVFMPMFEDGESFQGANVDAAGRLRTTDTTQSPLLLHRVAWQSLKWFI